MGLPFGIRAMDNENSGRPAAASNFWAGRAALSDRLAYGGSVGSSPPGRPSASARSEGDHQWLENWQRNEIRWLTNKVEELERQLRWRTIILGSALVLSILTAGAAAGWAVSLLDRDSPGLAVLNPSVLVAPVPREPLATPSAEQAPQIATAPEDQRRPTSPETASPVDAPGASLPAEKDAEQAAQLWASQAERALDAMIELPAEEDAEQAAQAWVLEAERALDSMIEEASPDRTAADPTSTPADEVVQIRPLETDEVRTEAAAEGTDRPHQASALEPAAGAAPGQHEEPRSLELGRRDTAPSGGAAGRAEYHVSNARVNLRTAPSAAAAVLAVVPQGDLVRLIGRERNWLRVEYSDADAGSVTGWVHTDYLRRVARPWEDRS